MVAVQKVQNTLGLFILHYMNSKTPPGWRVDKVENGVPESGFPVMNCLENKFPMCMEQFTQKLAS